MRAREALRLEREAHARMRQEFEEFKHLVGGLSGVDDIVRVDMDQPLPTIPSMGTVLVETTIMDTPEQSMSRTGEATASDEAIMVESASPIAKRVTIARVSRPCCKSPRIRAPG